MATQSAVQRTDIIEIPAGGLKQLRKETAPRIIEKLVEAEKHLSELISALKQVAETGDLPSRGIASRIEDATDSIYSAANGMQRVGID